MKVKSIVLMLAVLLMISFPVIAAQPSEQITGHDYSFGLSDEFPAVKAFREGEMGADTLERFMQVRSELPNELPLFSAYETEGRYEIYVALNGSDSGAGTKESPFRSIERGMEKAASLVNCSNGIVIYLRGGIYNMQNGLTIPDSLQGSDGRPVIISAYPGETVKFTGGISISGERFKVADDAEAMRKLPEAVKGKVYSVNLKELGYTELPELTTSGVPKLSVDGTEYTIARWPNSENVGMKKYEGDDAVNGVIDPGPIPRNNTANMPYIPDYGQGFEFQVINPRPFSWENTEDIWMYGSFSAEYFQNYSRIHYMYPEKQSIRTFNGTQYGASYNAHHTYYYLNVLEELDIPGEWFLDKNTGMLYIYPVKELKNSSVDITLSKQNIVKFSKGNEYVVLNNIDFSGTATYAIAVNGYRNVIQNCTIHDSGNGVQFVNAKNCGLINSDIYGSVDIKNSLRNDEQNLDPTRNFVQNNVIYDGQISLRYGVQQIIAHNTIINSPSMCIYVANTPESIVEYNEVVGGPYRTIDGGIVYLEGATNNIYNHIRYNYFHHSTVETRKDPFGIYFDDLTSNNFAYGNILGQANMYMHGGMNNTFYNNVIIDDESAYSALKNSSNYYRGGMVSRFLTYLYGSSSVYWNSSGNMKIGQVTWKNRYPLLYDFFKGKEQIDTARLNSDYVRGEAESEWIRPKRNVYMNTLMYNSGGPSNNNDLEGGTALWKDNYIVPSEEDKDFFVDYDNMNYNIASYDKVRAHIPTFEEIPLQECRGVTNRIVVQGEEIYPMAPVSPELGRTFINNITFKWTKNVAANYYHFELATDPEFKNIVAEQDSIYNYFTLDEDLEIATVYYWRVTAIALGQCVENKRVVMDTASFETYTYEEAAANTVLNLSAYESEVEAIRVQAEQVIREDTGVDIGIGVYSKGTKDKVLEMLESSKKRMEGYQLQYEVDKEISYIKQEYLNILYDNAIPYTRAYKSFDINNWSVSKETAHASVNGDTLSITTESTGCAVIHDTRALTPKEKVKFMINLGDISEWNAFGVKQVETDNKDIVTSANGYYIIAKQDALELQRYPVIDAAIKASTVNTDILKPNTWHEVEVSCGRTENGGSKIILTVDGSVIFDYDDDTSPINEIGYFSVQINGTSSKQIQLKTVD